MVREGSKLSSARGEPAFPAPFIKRLSCLLKRAIGPVLKIRGRVCLELRLHLPVHVTDPWVSFLPVPRCRYHRSFEVTAGFLRSQARACTGPVHSFRLWWRRILRGRLSDDTQPRHPVGHTGLASAFLGTHFPPQDSAVDSTCTRSLGVLLPDCGRRCPRLSAGGKGGREATEIDRQTDR